MLEQLSIKYLILSKKIKKLFTLSFISRENSKF